MRSLLIITIGIVLLGGYLEWTTHRLDTPQKKQPLSTRTQSPETTKVIREEVARLNRIIESREAKKSATTVSTVTPSKPLVRKTPLNLTIPQDVNGAINISFPQHRQSLQWNNLTNTKEPFSYGAELVFDAKEGSTITGGKVNVRIPFG